MTPEDEKRFAEIEASVAECFYVGTYVSDDEVEWLIVQLRAEKARADAAERKIARVVSIANELRDNRFGRYDTLDLIESLDDALANEEAHK